MMFRARRKNVAEQLAKDHKLPHGFSAIDGRWYVGHATDLERCGVPSIEIIPYKEPK